MNPPPMEIVDVVSRHKRRVDAFIRDRSDPELESADQFYDAVRQRLIPDEFEA